MAEEPEPLTQPAFPISQIIGKLPPTALTRIEELQTSKAHPRVVAYIQDLLTVGTDFDCYKINAFRIAQGLGVTPREAVTALLYATRLGLFDLNWDVHCPSCKGLPAYHKHLMGLASTAHCGLCAVDWAVDFEEQVEVTFTPNSEFRRLEYKDFKDRTYPEQLVYFREIAQKEGRGPALVGQFAAGQGGEVRGTVEAGDYFFYLPSHAEKGGKLRVSADAPNDPLKVSVDADGAVSPRELTTRPGSLAIAVDYRYPRDWTFAVFKRALPKNWVSAAYVTSLQDFRDLFSGEFLAPDVSFAIRSATLLFTDIKGSTEMYERMGDAKAYRLVQDHFRLMTEAIRRHDGAIVKTIGDAVMAAFPVNANAVKAACEIQIGFTKESRRLEGIEVKIGVHRGPAIAVTTNRSLDYFGRTVNVAARIQGQSHPKEVLLSAPVHADPIVQAFLGEKNHTATPRQATLKGISEAQTLYSVQPG